jgi:polygalacturonase
MLNSICFYNKVVLYWDLPESYTEGNKYVITTDGKTIGETKKCHFEVQDLKPESNYEFLVEMVGENSCTVGKLVCVTQMEKEKIDITKPPYNAVGDGKTLNTEKIQAAINDCKENQCVYIPSGDFSTGSLFLHSNIELYLEKDAILHGTTDVKDYEPKIKSRFEGHEMMTYAGLLNIGELDRENGFNCENVRIWGEGTICGGGRELALNVVDVETVLMKDYLDSLGDKIKECETSITIQGRVRPRLINISCAKNVTISGINIMNGASWNVHMIYSDNIVTYNCIFRSENVWNGDGWDPDSSTNCTLFGSEFYTGDDAVAIKSGKNPEGNIINKPCEHIRIFDCISHFGHGISIGSEMSGGVSDVKIWNCDIRNSLCGVHIKGTKKRGGYVRNVSVSHSEVCRILMRSVTYNDDGEGAPTAPVFEDCTFENITITAKKRNKNNEDEYCEVIELSGFDIPGHFIKNIKFKNIKIDNGEDSRRQAIYLQCCEGISFENITCY